MNNMQQQNEYMQTLKSIPDLLEEYFLLMGLRMKNRQNIPRSGKLLPVFIRC